MAEVAGSQTSIQNQINTLSSKITTNETASSSVYRNVWFSDSADDLKRVHNTSFQYNPGTDDLKVGTINGKTVKQITVKDYVVPFDAWAAGTIGTRAAQKTVDISADKGSYGTVMSVSIVFVGDSSTANYQAFVYDSNNLLYVNAYRATANAVAAQPLACHVRIAYVK